jgi:hypothetical protein
MTDIGIFGSEEISLFFPRKIIVMTTGRKSIVARPNYFILGIDNAGPHLGARVFTSSGR